MRWRRARNSLALPTMRGGRGGKKEDVAKEDFEDRRGRATGGPTLWSNLAGVSSGTARGVIVQVNISAGGVPKRPIPEAAVGELGLAGDVQRNRRFHGGPARAVCLYAVERLEALAAEGHPIAAGSTGENITTRGLPWERVVPGVRLRLGTDLLIEVTAHAPPCKQNARWFSDGDFSRLDEDRHPGWSRVYARVLKPGSVHPGDPIELLP